MQKYVIALYIRLSIEDYKYDSMSKLMKEKPGIQTICKSGYLFIICKPYTSMPKGVLESVLEFILESEYQALELLDFSPITAYNISNISCFSRKSTDFPLCIIPHEPWHPTSSRYQAPH